MKNILTKKIKDFFPELRFENVDIINDDSRIILILDKKFVFIFPTDQSSKDKFSVELSMVPKIMGNITMDVPVFKYIPSDKSFVGYDLMAGNVLSVDEFKKLNLAEQDMMANQLSIFLNELHSFPLPVARRDGVLQALEDEVIENCKKLLPTINKKLEKEKTSSLNHIFERCCQNRKNIYKYVLTHHNLRSDNIVFSTKEKTINGIIGFSDLKISDPAVDFGYLWELGESFVDKILQGYFLNDDDLKKRSYRWYFYKSIEEMHYGIVTGKNDYWEQGCGLLDRDEMQIKY